MNIGISSGWDSKFRCPYVAVQVYGSRTDGKPPTPEQVGRAYGALRRVADETLEADPFATFSWKVSNRPAIRSDADRYVCAYLYLGLLCHVSSGDVLEGGPLHRRRAGEVAKTMRAALDKAVPMRVNG